MLAVSTTAGHGPPAGVAASGAETSPARASSSLARWWPLAALTLLAAALRLSTLDLQSFWYDEAFTPVHVLHPSLWATLRSVARVISVEARHAAWVRDLAGQQPAPHATDAPISAEQAMNAIRPFMA